jgi:SH3-like domain-containing protein
MMTQFKRGLMFVAAIFATESLVMGAPSATAAKTYHIVGVEEGQTAHMRSRPASRAKPVGYIPADAHGVVLVGACVRDWCQVRYGEKTGWVSRGLLEPEPAEAGEEIPQHVNSSPAPDDAAKLAAEDLSRGGLPAAPQPQDSGRQPDASAGAEPSQSSQSGASPRPKTYVIAGVASGATLELRDGPADDAKVVGAVPYDANELEVLEQSVKKWRQVRYRGTTGWMLGRHLAEAGASGQRFRVTGVSMLESAPVREYPSPEAGIIGSLPSYASGIVAIGACDGQWRHIRYLGLVGWVECKRLEPLTERRG